MLTKELVQSKDGRLSTSDAFLFFFTGMLFLTWLAAGVGVFLSAISYADYQEWFGDGVSFVYVSVIPYIAKRYSERKAN